MTAVLPDVPVRFALPDGAEADRPPEQRGVPRDQVRLLVSRPDGVQHRRFADLPDLLEPGDLVVVNTSATLAAALPSQWPDGTRAPLHVSTVLDDGAWVVEPRRPDGSGPAGAALRAGDVVRLPDDLDLHLEPWPGSPRLFRAVPSRASDVGDLLARHGRPISYAYLSARYPLADHQTVFGTEPGSAEMASAGRPFTAELVVRLVTQGVAVAPVLLHAGVSSAEAHEPPGAERFAVPAATARLVTTTRAAGRRVVAVGTTVTRALESAAAEDGTVTAAQDWTDLVLGPQRPAHVVTGLVTGLHAPEASHLLLLESVAGGAQVREAYAAALAERYLWHEFGDSSLFLP